MTIKLLALDLDGTLLNEDKVISPVNRAALMAARERGVKIVLTTGRPLKSVQGFLEELDLIADDQYAITFNGGLIQRNTGQILAQEGFGLDAITTIRQITEQLSLPLDVLHGGDVYVLPSQKPSLYPICNPLLNFISSELTDLDDTATFNKAISSQTPDFLDVAFAKIPAQLFEQFEIFKSRPEIIEWSPKGVHKANGLAKLIAHLGLEQSQVMACGDEDNDLSMIEWAGLGVCMANGSDSVKALADVITPMTNDQDAVAWAIHQYILDKD